MLLDTAAMYGHFVCLWDAVRISSWRHPTAAIYGCLHQTILSDVISSLTVAMGCQVQPECDYDCIKVFVCFFFALVRVLPWGFMLSSMLPFQTPKLECLVIPAKLQIFLSFHP